MDYTVAVITVSESSFRGERKDAGGKLLAGLAERKLGKVIHTTIIPDDRDIITGALLNCVDNVGADIVLTVGGTGVSSHDVTPEATAAVIEREIPGICEVIRREAYDHTPTVVLSRGKAGIRRKTLIVNLPEDPRIIENSFLLIVPGLKRAVESLKSVCPE